MEKKSAFYSNERWWSVRCGAVMDLYQMDLWNWLRSSYWPCWFHSNSISRCWYALIFVPMSSFGIKLLLSRDFAGLLFCKNSFWNLCLFFFSFICEMWISFEAIRYQKKNQNNRWIKFSGFLLFSFLHFEIENKNHLEDQRF